MVELARMHLLHTDNLYTFTLTCPCYRLLHFDVLPEISPISCSGRLMEAVQRDVSSKTG